MKKQYFCFALLFWLIYAPFAMAQNATIEGFVYEKNTKQPIEFAIISANGQNVTANEKGFFSITLPAVSTTVLVQRVGYLKKQENLNLKDGEVRKINIFLEADKKMMDSVEIKSNRYDEKREEISLIKLDPRVSKVLPSPFGDFTRVLATLPGVVSNNELSTQYSVRGGSYDENLVYVNDIEIYRPFIVRAGQQEGLSFVNPDMTADVSFSAGGWQPRFGDKLASVLDIKYKEPTKFGGSITAGMLTNALHLEGATKSKKVNFVLGARQKSGRYLYRNFLFFKGLPVQGQYFPNFYDVQGYTNIHLTEKTKLGILMSYAQNDYEVIPESRETQFGTATQVLRLNMFYDGNQQMNYRTTQGGIKLSHRFNDKFRSDLIASGVYSFEREKNNLYAAYRLCDVQSDFSRADFNQCIQNRGAGVIFDYARNDLDVGIAQVLNRNYYVPEASHAFEWGFNYAYHHFADKLYEYEVVDSADYANVTEFLETANTLSTQRIEAYAQHTWYANDKLQFTYGLRLNYWNYSKELLFSPRLQASYRPDWTKNIMLKAAVGSYQQPPMYREMRNLDGRLNPNIKAQKSWHFIAGGDYVFKMWKRPFKFTAETYFKPINAVIPYVIDDIRIRYLARNDAKAYATGLDLRLSGEFIPGNESWFSLSIMDTKEKIANETEWVNRPVRQLVTFNIFFQDHLPIDTTFKVYLNLNYGTGFSHGPPNDLERRAAFGFRPYRRVDIGFAKEIRLNQTKKIAQYVHRFWIGLDVLNLLGVDNDISYTWIKDVANNNWAVPNASTQRFYNLRLQASF